jgi:N-acyl-D-aspartate/D-glutamate deacylase
MATEWQLDTIDTALRIIRTDARGVGIASFNMVDADIDLLMQQPWMMTGSDGSAGHPRMYATFPEKYARYVRERRVITLASFIRQSTGRTADTLKIARRGYLRPGYFADVLVFDPATYAPRADYVHPRELSVGVTTLLVNGVPVIDGGVMGAALPGRPLPRTKIPHCPS